jgi:DNA (cytosine-5)-methyltransferase 1
MWNFYEFFAGGGMARAGLGEGWNCLFANDIDPKKGASYVANWGANHFRCADVQGLTTADLPGVPALSWASFPCQDLSLAGNRAGLQGERSGTFWAFWRLMEELVQEGRAPQLIVLENVYGAIRSHNGADFAAIGDTLAASGYRFGAMVMDAVHFLPQSRPRLFIVCLRNGSSMPENVFRSTPDPAWHPAALIEAKDKLNASAAAQWIWWNPGPPPLRSIEFSDIIEEQPQGLDWRSEEKTRELLAMMTDINRAKVQDAKTAGRRMVGGVYKRTRQGVQRAEVRFDVAGCLRTPVGGSSRQTILVVDGENVRSRLLSPREAARLMGLPESYRLPEKYNEAYHLAGDGLAAPVVRFLAEKILEPLLKATKNPSNKEAA